MKRAISFVLLGIVWTICELPSAAVCIGTSVSAYGAKGDGHTDDTAAIQNAIRAASAAGGGSVVFNVALYYTTGTLVVPTGVVLCGALEGPFDVSTANPAVTPVAPTLLVTSTSSPFITLQGIGAGVTDLLFHYPNQVFPTASAPNVYPYTIMVTAPGTKVARSMVTNAYNFLDIESGRVVARDLFIGAFHYGINIDHAYDHVTVRNVINQVYWGILNNGANGGYPSAIDTWVYSNGIALVVNRADNFEVHDFNVFSRHAGLLLTDSSDATQTPRCGFGTGSDIDLDSVEYGIIVTASNSAGYEFTNIVVGGAGPPGVGQAAVQVNSGGSMPPEILINGGSVVGGDSFVLGAFPTPGAGHLTHINIIGSDLPWP